MTTPDTTALIERLEAWADMADMGRGPDPDDMRREAATTLRTLADKVEQLRADNARLREVLGRVSAALEYVPPETRIAQDDRIIASLNAGLSLRQTARKHGVGVGTVRGAKARAALKGTPNET